MLKSEFEKLAGVVVSEFLYKFIEEEYLNTDLDKAAFAELYKNNNNSLATNICRMADDHIREISERVEDLERLRTADRLELEEQIKKLEEQIKKLTEQLDKEQEWQPYIYPEEVQQEEYEHCKIAARPLSIDEAIEKVCDEYGFAPAKVTILTLAPAYEKNRHGIVRRVIAATIKRDPLWCATDDNYIRFNCAGYHYEMHNGELHQI